MTPTLAHSSVTAIAPAVPALALAHFSAALQFETDCADVHAALEGGQPDFVLLDVRSGESYREGHIPGAVNLPHRQITAERLAAWPRDTVFVVHCAGPHCNGAHRAAVRLAGLERPVKLMIGGMTGWIDEGLPVVRAGE